MKKQLLAIALLAGLSSQAQVWSENFSSPTPPALPAGWFQNNVDGNTVVGNLSAYNFGSNAWVTRDFTSTLPAYGKVAVSTSWYSPAGTSNDWLISPAFVVPVGAALNWEAMAPDASFADGYQVRISTAGTLVADFNANPSLFTIGSENSSFTQRGVSLNTYSNQTVHIAFRNNSVDKYLLFLDNINVNIPATHDGKVVSIANLTRWLAGAGPQSITNVFQNVGSTAVTSAVLNYNVNNGPVTTETLNFSSLGYYGSGNYTFATPANLTIGSNQVKVWVTHVNGVAETNLANDTASAFSYVTSQSAPRRALIEEFTSSTCPPCASLNSSFDPLLASNNVNTGGDVNAIKYQVNWPSPGNDPSYNAHSAARVSYYGITGAPSVLYNGIEMGGPHDQTKINNAKAVPGYIGIAPSITVTGNNISASSTITPYITISANSPLRVHQVLLQKFYNYPGASTTQKNYSHVMRQMFPNAAGTTYTVTDGVPFNVNFNHTANVVTQPAQNSFDFWQTTNLEFEYVSFVQDNVSGDILNSASAIYTVNTGVVEFKNDNKLGVYPNPAKEYAVVGLLLSNSSVVDITITDINGKVVYTQQGNNLNAGQNEIKINTGEFATGAYNVVVKCSEGVLSEKIIVTK